MTNAPHVTLKKYFGYESFRGNQQAIIEHIIAKRNTLVLMPTGAGEILVLSDSCINDGWDSYSHFSPYCINERSS